MLTSLMRSVVALRQRGEPFEQIGRSVGISKSRAEETFAQAAERIREIAEREQYGGLREVYRSEVRRGKGR